MSKAYRDIIRSAASNGVFFLVAAGVFIAFSIFYTRQFGVEHYGEFSFFLNTVTALISLGAYEGFLVAHSVTETRARFDDFNRRFNPLNIGLMLVAGIAFSAVAERIDPWVVLPIATAIYLDYRSQSSIAVLITAADNWKIRAIRTVYQVLLIALFLILQEIGLGIDHSFAAAALAAAIANYGLLLTNAVAGLEISKGKPNRSDVTARILAIAILTNLATVLALLLDKVAIRQFDIGTDYSVGVYFLYFDLATRAEALYLLLGVPVTNYLFNCVNRGDLPRQDIILMTLACLVAGVLFGAAGHVLVPLIYAVSLDGIALIPWLFGIYIAARGIRYIIKAVCNAAGHHEALLASNVIVLVSGLALMALVLGSGAGVMSIVALAGVIAAAHVARAPILIWLLAARPGRARPIDAGAS